MRVLTAGNHSRVSSARAVGEFGLHFRPLHQTVSDAVQWYREHDWLSSGGPMSR